MSEPLKTGLGHAEKVRCRVALQLKIMLYSKYGGWQQHDRVPPYNRNQTWAARLAHQRFNQ
jgi:hypothetical protein